MSQLPDSQEFDIYLAKMMRFTHFLSHDIRQPLETLVLVLEKALQRPGVDSHARIVESLADITTALARMDDLIEHYFSLARLVELYSEPVELGAMVEAFALEMRQQCADRGITLRLEGLTALGLVRLHLHAFRHVLMRLVENALDAMPHGGVLTFRGARQGSHVRLEIQDTGRSIPEDALPLLFEPFCTIKPEGTELGLDAVQEILVAHRGVIMVTRTPGSGTTCVLMLPLTVVQGTDPTSQAMACRAHR